MEKQQGSGNCGPPRRTGGGRMYKMSFPTKWGGAAESSGEVHGDVSDKDGDAGALSAPARPRHCGYSGGGQPPPPTVSWTCWCTKCTRIAVLVASVPGHPCTGHRRDPPFVGKDILYVLPPPSVWGGPQLPPCCCFSMSSHLMTRHGNAAGRQQLWTP